MKKYIWTFLANSVLKKAIEFKINNFIKQTGNNNIKTTKHIPEPISINQIERGHNVVTRNPFKQGEY